MFDILMYLFENYMNESSFLQGDLGAIVVKLEEVGFYRNDIGHALEWLQGLNDIQSELKIEAGSGHSIRYFLPEESERLGRAGKAFLLTLEQLKILDPVSREIVLDRLLALDPREVDLGKIKWIVLFVLFSQPHKKQALSLLQDMVLSEARNRH